MTTDELSCTKGRIAGVRKRALGAPTLFGKDAYGLDISGSCRAPLAVQDLHHATECCAGYYNTNKNDAYGNIADMFKSFGACLTYVRKSRQAGTTASYFSDPEALVYQVTRTVLMKVAHLHPNRRVHNSIIARMPRCEEISRVTVASSISTSGALLTCAQQIAPQAKTAALKAKIKFCGNALPCTEQSILNLHFVVCWFVRTETGML